MRNILPVADRRALWRSFRSDRFLWITIGFFALVALLQLVPILSHAQLVYFNDVPAYLVFLLLALAASWRTIARITHSEERRFWLYLTASLCTWLLATSIYVSQSKELRGPDSYFGSDILFTVHYLLVALACETHPHLPSGWSRRNVLHWLESIGAVIFAAGFFIFISLIARLLNPAFYATLAPSVILYLSLDAFLVVRFAYLAWACEDPRWNTLYRIFALTFACIALADLRDTGIYWAITGFEGGSLWDLLWFAQFLGLIFAARLAIHWKENPQLLRPSGLCLGTMDQPHRAISPLVFYAVALPLIHFGTKLFGLFDPVTETLREWLLLAYVVVLGGMAIGYQVLLERQARRLRQDLLAAQQQLQQAQKMDSLSRFAAGVAHDFNNLLTVILGYGELLVARPDLPDAVRSSISYIHRAGQSAADLTRQLLTFSRRQIVQSRVVDLSRLLAGLAGRIQSALGQQFEFLLESDGSDARVSIDPLQFEQAILQLAQNAREAMPEGGEFTLQVACVHLDDVFVRRLIGVPSGPYVRLAATDNGPGMDSYTREHAFEPFFTTREKGAGGGLGLSLVYGIVKQSEGHVEISSEPGRGATVWIYLPRVLAAAPEPVLRFAMDASTAATRTILLVDDEVALLKLNQAFLENLGYRVLPASSGADALRLAGEYTAEIDLLLTDVVMPAMTGPDLAARLLVLRPQLKVLYVSGFTGGASLPIELQPAGSTLLQKPYPMEALARKVQQILEAKRVP